MSEQSDKLRIAVSKITESLALIPEQFHILNQIADEIQDPLPSIDPQPITPTDLVARLTGSICELVWTHIHTAGNDISFEIQRDDNATVASQFEWQTIAVVNGDLSTFEDKWPDATDRPYAYRVRALNSNNYVSNWSNVADPAPFVIEIPADNERTSVESGFDFKGKTGKYFANNGTYSNFEPESGLDILGESRDGVIIEMKPGQQLLHRGAENVIFSNLTIDGKGKAGAATKLNDKAMLIPGIGWKLINFRATGSQGVNIGCDGRNIRIINVESDHGGSAGIGGKADASILINVHCHDNNLTVQDRDGACGGKWTRTNAQLKIDCLIERGTCAGDWWDINNSNIVCIRSTIRDISLASADRKWTAVGFKCEISANKSEGQQQILALCKEANVLRATVSLDGVTEDELKTWNYIYKDCKVSKTFAYCCDWNETRDIFWDGGELEDAPSPTDGGSIGVRNLPRADAGDMAKDWVLDNILVSRVKATTGILTLWGSSAGNSIGLVKYHIRLEGVKGTVKYKKVNP